MSRPDVILSADLVASRRAPDRLALARLLHSALRKLERRFETEWRAPLRLTRGIDELSGVLTRLQPVFDVVVDLNQAVWPQHFRFAVAVGEIDVGRGQRDASAMDGAGFHLASDAMARARAEELPLALALPGVPEATCRMAENLARLHSAIQRGWTPSQSAAVSAYRATGSQRGAARRLRITQQAVSAALRAAQFREMGRAEDALRAWLGSISLASASSGPQRAGAGGSGRKGRR